MKNLILFIGIICLGTFQASSQINFGTGDKTLETELNQINVNANKNIDEFALNMTKELNTTKSTIDGYLQILKPAELVLADRIGKITGKPLVTVIDVYKKDKDKGWGAIAKELGIKPGSPEFHQLKGKSKNTGNSKGKGNGKGNGQGKKK